ncbi:MAG: hypothetical protein ACM3PV_05150 [Betaproteobacteria bacterium]
MAVDPVETQDWARQNKAAWEVAPLVEMHRGERTQVGFELSLYARLPPETQASSAEETALEGLWDRLREIAESLLPIAGDGARIEIDPFDAAGRLRPETNFAQEVLLTARLFHASDYFTPVADADRDRMKPLEARLTALGLRQRSW